MLQQAVKLADAALKKYKGDQLVRALKGYALHRTGKAEEALQVMHVPAGMGWRCNVLGGRWVLGGAAGAAGKEVMGHRSAGWLSAAGANRGSRQVVPSPVSGRRFAVAVAGARG